MNTAGRTLAALTALLLAVLLLAAGCGGPSEAELRAARADEEARSYAASLPSFDKDLLLSWMTEDLETRPAEVSRDIGDTFDSSAAAENFLSGVSAEIEEILLGHYLLGLSLDGVTSAVRTEGYHSSLSLQYDWSDEAASAGDYRQGGPYDKGIWSEDALREYVTGLITSKTAVGTAVFSADGQASLPDEKALLDMTQDDIRKSEYTGFLVDHYNVRTRSYGDAVIVYTDFSFNDRSVSEIFDLPDGMTDASLIEMLIENETDWNRPVVLRVSSDRSEEDLSFLTEIAAANDCYDLPAQPDMRYASAWPGEYGKKIVELSFSFTPGTENAAAQREAMDDTIDEAAEIVAARSAGMPPEGILRETADFICGRCEYDESLASAMEAGGLLSDKQVFAASAYGALVEGRSVCSGYAAAFKAVCDKLGIPAWVVVGQIRDEYGYMVDHAWNAVLVDGGIFYVDPTFLDQDPDGSYFLLPEMTDHDRTPDEKWILPW